MQIASLNIDKKHALAQDLQRALGATPEDDAIIQGIKTYQRGMIDLGGANLFHKH